MHAIDTITVHMQTHMCIYVYTYMHMCIISTSLYVYIYIYGCIHASVIYIYMYTYIIYILSNIYIYKTHYTHTHIHTYTQCLLGSPGFFPGCFIIDIWRLVSPDHFSGVHPWETQSQRWARRTSTLG